MHDNPDELSRLRHVWVAAFIISNRTAAFYDPTFAETGHAQ